MSKTLVCLIGFRGSGRFTIARKLSEITDAVIVSNNLFNNVVLNVVKLQNTEVLDGAMGKILSVRENMLAVLGKHHIKSKHYIFTNKLIDGDSYNKRVYSSVVNLGKNGCRNFSCNIKLQ